MTFSTSWTVSFSSFGATEIGMSTGLFMVSDLSSSLAHHLCRHLIPYYFPREEEPREEQPREEQPKDEEPQEEQPDEEQPKEEHPREEQPRGEESKEEEPTPAKT